MDSLLLITDEYRKLNEQLHARIGGYGGKGCKWIDDVYRVIKSAPIRSVLDYGCGQGMLWKELSEKCSVEYIAYQEYDPAIKGKDNRPDPADLVICTNVLEHI